MSDRISFIRSDLAQLAAYTAHPGGENPGCVDRLDTNESPLDLPAEIKSKLAWAYQQEIEANRYPDGSHHDLKSAIADYVQETANSPLNLSTANISVGNGSDELIRSLLIATCLGGCGSILVATPTFSMYGILAQTLGIPVVSLTREVDSFALNIATAIQAIETTSNPPIRVVFMVHPNSPTANCLTDKELDWLRNLPENVLVVIDEAYFEFSQISVVDELSQHPNWVILRTFSKAFRLAAHRVGYAIASTDLIAVLEKVRLPYNLPSFSQVAAKTVLQQRQLLLPEVAETIQERKRVLSVLQADDNLQVWSSMANFVYLRPQVNSEDDYESVLFNITQQLKSQGTLIRHTGGGLRITIGTPAENDRTLERLKQIIGD
ncbi:aminotransferase class I and II [Chondrocystis sp. NIES-4102]|nr:aminotransferase class I and II [Chondrocystis sp. NIES-4102]